MPSLKSVALAAIAAAPALASDWSPVKPITTPAVDCKPWYEEYVCDDDMGKEYWTTYTLYSKGCPGYTVWADYPPKQAKPTNVWDPVKPTPANTWDPVYTTPAATWGGYKPGKPQGDRPYWDGKGPKPAHWDDWEGYYGKPTGAQPYWDHKGPKPAHWDDWEGYGPAPTGVKPYWDGKGPKPAHWDDWEGYGVKVVTITLTEYYEVPCETGWETTSTVWYTTHCGCTETPVPEHPAYLTTTTVCPESWGSMAGKTVTVTVPDCTYTPTPVAAASTWSVYATPVAGVSTWSTYAAPVAGVSTWSTYAVPAGASGSCGTPTASTVYSSYCNAWATWDTAKTACPTWATTSYVTSVYPATCTGSAWSPIATYKGAADKQAIGMGALAIAGLAALL